MQYDKRYDDLIEQIEATQNEEAAIHDEPDYEKILHTLSDDWKEIYNNLDAEHKRAYWRSFIEERQ